MTDDKILLATQKKGTADKAHDGQNIGEKMEADPAGEVNAAGTALKDTSEDIEAKLLERNALQDDVKELTNDLEDLEDDWDDHYKAAAGKAQEIYPDDSGIWEGYGFDLADTEPTARPAPPKVTGLQVTQGDAAGEGDLVWNPQGKDVNDGYFTEVNPTDPIDPGTWVSGKPRSVTASKVTITGLTTGQKYHVRIIAYVGTKEGPPSDPKSFIAP